MKIVGVSPRRETAEIAGLLALGGRVLRPILSFTVEGVPVGQGALSFLGKGRPAVHSNRKTLLPWRAKVCGAALLAMPPELACLAGPVAVDMFFTVPRPASREGQARPFPIVNSATNYDTDHLERAVLDALKGAVYLDDRQVLGGVRWKDYPGGTAQCPPVPGVNIHIYRLGEPA